MMSNKMSINEPDLKYEGPIAAINQEIKVHDFRDGIYDTSKTK
jgi:hypothetical protein